MKCQPKVKLYTVKERIDGNWKLCPLCDAELSGCHIGGYCSNEGCHYVDGVAWLDKVEYKKFKDKVE
jgi:Zn-finger nucleic acid-binding protein